MREVRKSVFDRGRNLMKAYPTFTAAMRAAEELVENDGRKRYICYRTWAGPYYLRFRYPLHCAGSCG